MGILERGASSPRGRGLLVDSKEVAWKFFVREEKGTSLGVFLFVCLF